METYLMILVAEQKLCSNLKIQISMLSLLFVIVIFKTVFLFVWGFFFSLFVSVIHLKFSPLEYYPVTPWSRTLLIDNFIISLRVFTALVSKIRSSTKGILSLSPSFFPIHTLEQEGSHMRCHWDLSATYRIFLPYIYCVAPNNFCILLLAA